MRLADDIRSGLLDDELPEIEAAVQARRTALDELWRQVLPEGESVKFIENIVPKYLAGLGGTVTGKDGAGRILVELDEKSRLRIRGRRFDYDGAVRCWPSHLEPVV